MMCHAFRADVAEFLNVIMQMKCNAKMKYVGVMHNSGSGPIVCL